MKDFNTDPGAVGTALERQTADFLADRPLRVEIDAIERILTGIDIGVMTCLDAGFPNPVGSLALRRLGGYWTTVDWTRERCRQAAEILQEEVLQGGARGELPFDDKQFDVVVVARGHLTGDPAQDVALIQECHRVLKTPGYLIISGDYRKRINVAGLLARKPDRSARPGYNEKQIFDLLKTGFDVLGVKTYCRFWVQVMRLLLDSPERSKGRTTAFLYWVASRLDTLLFFAKGYQLLAYGRRKGWRERQPLDARHGMHVSEAVLRRPRM
jgi:SAM-dependent methyltransferase